jgi:hypothetical protein
MSIFLLSNSLIKEIENMLNAFWWGHGKGSTRDMHWLSWFQKNMAAWGLKLLEHSKWQWLENTRGSLSQHQMP